MDLIPTSGPVILVGNHVSWLDPIFLACEAAYGPASEGVG
ncbi:MAG: 1-acyl-sn-glycerol-3-phosphate acyltransferase [Candidatus Limnocylindrus sp.]